MTNHGMKMLGSPWSKISSDSAQPTSLADIMSEELAIQLERENAHAIDPSIAQYGLSAEQLGDSPTDLTVARALQKHFDREFEVIQKRYEGNVTPQSRFFEMSCEPYNPSYDSNYAWKDELSEDDDDDLREIATNLLYSKPEDGFPPSGYYRDVTGHFITKHNKDITERKNTDKMMQLSIGFPTGDMIGERLSNKVYNSLRSYSKMDQRRNARVKDKEESSANELDVDIVSRLIFLKWVNSGVCDQIDYPIATGKESVVIHGLNSADDSLNVAETHVALKVYKMNLAEFKNRSEYVQDDYRFKNPRSVLRVWARKEYMNLHRMVRSGVKCPRPISIKKHVMLMSFIGSNGVAAPKLKFVEWEKMEEKFDAFGQVKEAMLLMYKKCDLVHGDLSEFNILYHEKCAYIIDVSQAVDVSHPRSLFFLVRDIENVLSFFTKIDTQGLPTSTELFNQITGLNMDSTRSLTIQVEHFETINRSVQRRQDKAKPADRELRLYDTEIELTHVDCAQPYN